jgi:hypothetical protein
MNKKKEIIEQLVQINDKLETITVILKALFQIIEQKNEIGDE